MSAGGGWRGNTRRWSRRRRSSWCCGRSAGGCIGSASSSGSDRLLLTLGEKTRDHLFGLLTGEDFLEYFGEMVGAGGADWRPLLPFDEDVRRVKPDVVLDVQERQ